MTATNPPVGPGPVSLAEPPGRITRVIDLGQDRRPAPPSATVPAPARTGTDPHEAEHSNPRTLALVGGGALGRFLARTTLASKLTPTELHAVLLLRASDGLAMNLDDLAAALDMAFGAGDGVATRLEAAGLAVSNRALPAGGRARLHLTGDGKRLADKTMSQLRVALTAGSASRGLTPARLVHDVANVMSEPGP